MSCIALNHINSPTWTPLKSWESLLRSVWLGCWKSTPLWLGCSKSPGWNPCENRTCQIKNYISKCPAKFNRNPGYKNYVEETANGSFIHFLFPDFVMFQQAVGEPSSILWGYDRTFCRSKFTHPYRCFRKWWYPQIIHFNRVFHYFHHPFWGKIPYFWKPPYCFQGKDSQGQQIGQTIQYTWTFQFGCQMVPKGCPFTIPSGLIGTLPKVY